MFPASLINSCYTPPPPPTLPASLTPYPLACLPHYLPHFPTSFTHSIPPSPWLSYITLCLTDSPVSLPLPHSLPYIALPHPIPSYSPASLIHIFFTQSLPHFPLPNFPAFLSPSVTPLPPSFTFSLLSHCLTLPSLTHSCLFTLSITPCLTHSLSHFPFLIHSDVFTINSLVCLLLASFTP